MMTSVFGNPAGIVTLKRILVSVALILAVLAALIGIPGSDDPLFTDIASAIDSERDHISPLDLAEQLYGGRHIRLIDLRDSVSYAHERIANAELMSLRQLTNAEIGRREYTVLYSEGGIHASQAWILLKMKHCDSVYTLLGGFSGWKEEVLNPRLYGGATGPDKQLAERQKVLSLFFGGKPLVTPHEIPKKKSSRSDDNPRVKVEKKEAKLRYPC